MKCNALHCVQLLSCFHMRLIYVQNYESNGLSALFIHLIKIFVFGITAPSKDAQVKTFTSGSTCEPPHVIQTVIGLF